MRKEPVVNLANNIGVVVSVDVLPSQEFRCGMTHPKELK
jgi:hypothetical protein